MKENIALIPEVHHKTSRKDAEAKAIALLEQISLKHIANKRKNQCSDIEIFYVMYIRALMCDVETILVDSLFSLVNSLNSFGEIEPNLQLLNQNKCIIFLDRLSNKSRYKDAKCHIIE